MADRTEHPVTLADLKDAIENLALAQMHICNAVSRLLTPTVKAEIDPAQLTIMEDARAHAFTVSARVLEKLFKLSIKP